MKEVILKSGQRVKISKSDAHTIILHLNEGRINETEAFYNGTTEAENLISFFRISEIAAIV